MINPSRRSYEEFPPMVDEVCAHMKEMLVVGAIHPRQSPLCNVVVLVCKKGRGLCFWIDFHKLNARTKNDSCLPSQIQEAIESLVGARCFSCLDLKLGLWQIAMDKASNQYTAFTEGNLGFLSVNVCHFGCAMPLPLFKG